MNTADESSESDMVVVVVTIKLYAEMQEVLREIDDRNKV